MWGDAQKQMYSKGAGWTFWAWKVDPDATVLDQRMWYVFLPLSQAYVRVPSLFIVSNAGLGIVLGRTGMRLQEA